MKKILMLLTIMLPTVAMAQVIVVDVSVLSEKGSNERMGVVLQKDADNETFYNLIMELKSHSDKTSAIKTKADIKKRDAGGSADDFTNDAFAKLDELQKKGLISESEVKKMKADMSAQMSVQKQKDAEAMNMLDRDAALPGSSNPSALKEKIRNYCVGKRFFHSASKAVNGMVRVEARIGKKRRMGYIDAVAGQIVIEPNKYSNFNNGTTKGFTKDGYITGHSEAGADMLDRSGRVVLTGYKNLYFYNDCKILKAVNDEGKVGIIDYQGNVLEPFVHDDVTSESLAKAANRIFNEKGGVKVAIW